MLLSFDATSQGSATPGTSITFSHTISGTNPILLVFIGQAGDSSDVVTGVTYNGVAMTRIDTIPGAATCRSYAYILMTPAAGAHDVVVSASSSKFLRAISVSYKGALQSGQPDSYDQNGVTGTSFPTSHSTVADNCWNIAFCANDGASAMSASTGINAVRNSLSNVVYVGDSDGPKTPAGTYSMTWTCGVSQVIVGIQVSLKPDPNVSEDVLVTNYAFLM